MTRYTVIGRAQTRTARVLWMLNELDLPYEHLQAHPHDPVVTQHAAAGKVPVLLVDDAPVTDSTAIIQYLADRHAALTHPAGTLARARQDSLTQCILDEVDALLWTAARHSFILPPEHRVPAIKDSLRWELSRNLTRLADRIVGPFVMGAQMTVPDIVLTHCLLWAQRAKFPVEEPRIQTYGAPIMARPAFQRATAA